MSLLTMILHQMNCSNPTILLLVFTILAQQEEIARLKKQKTNQRQADLEKIKGEAKDILSGMKGKNTCIKHIMSQVFFSNHL